MKEFGKNMAKITGRPHWLPVPSFILHTLLGEMSMLILEGQHVLPQKLLNTDININFNIRTCITKYNSIYNVVLQNTTYLYLKYGNKIAED